MNTASAPVFSATPGAARINSVQARVSPATNSGCAIIASRKRAAADPIVSDSSPAQRAIARAKPAMVHAQLGAEQPSMP